MTQTLEDFLAYLAAEGQRDSAGSFTLDLDKAPDKFRAFHEQQPALWLTLAARAALAWGCPSLDVRVHGGSVQVDLPGAPSESILADPYGEGIWSEWSHPRVGLIVRALEALRTSSSGLSLGSRVLVAGALETLSPLPEGALRLSASLAPARLAEGFVTELRERLRYSPLPIYLNGHMLNSPLPHKAWLLPERVKGNQEPGLRRDFVQRVWLSAAPRQDLLAVADPLDEFAHRYLVKGRLLKGTSGAINLQQWCVPEGGNFSAEVTSGGGGGRSSPLRWKTPPPVRFDFPIETGWVDALFGGQHSRAAIGAGAVLRWGRKHRGQGWLYPVQQGVLLDPLELEPEFEGCWAFVAVPHLRTDLSHYRLIRDEACEALVDWVQGQFCEMGSTLRDYLAQGQAEALGLRFNNFLQESQSGASKFDSWANKDWGDPANDR